MAKPTQDTPSRNEDEFFAKQDAELLKQMRANQDKERAAQERKAHFMKCPKCGADLKEETHDHVKVDTCPECGGVWFDAGEMQILKHVQKSGGTIIKGLMDVFTRAGKK